MDTQYTRQTTCCFTGHRPEKLPWGLVETDTRCQTLKKRIRNAVREAYSEGFRHFLCGMARGCDFYFAEIVLELRDSLPGMALEAAIPCPTQANRWDGVMRERYQYLLSRCSRQTVVSPVFTPYCMPLRNRYMVDHSSLLIAAFDGTPGGTQGTVAYAIRKGIRVMDLHIETL